MFNKTYTQRISIFIRLSQSVSYQTNKKYICWHAKNQTHVQVPRQSHPCIISQSKSKLLAILGYNTKLISNATVTNLVFYAWVNPITILPNSNSRDNQVLLKFSHCFRVMTALSFFVLPSQYAAKKISWYWWLQFLRHHLKCNEEWISSKATTLNYRHIRHSKYQARNIMLISTLWEVC